MPSSFNFSAMNRVPESDKVRIGYRYRDFLEGMSCRSCGQKLFASLIPVIAGIAYLKEYKIKYGGHYPVLRASYLLGKAPFRQRGLWAAPMICLGVGVWWSELAFNRCILGIQGAEPLPDEIIKPSKRWVN